LSASGVSPDLYRMCGSWDPTCTPLGLSTSSCTPVTPPSVVVASCTSTFPDIPSIIDSPSGFVVALWTGVADWFTCIFANAITALLSGLNSFLVTFISGLLPADGYLTDKIAEVNDAWVTDQPGLTSIHTAFSDGIISLSSPTSLTPISIGALHVGGTTTSAITFFDPSEMPSGIFTTAKALISAFMYFGVAFWVVREMSTILSA